MAVPVPFIAFAWGSLSSRLLFVMAPAFVLLAVLALRQVQKPYLRYGAVALILAANIAWLVLSSTITL